MGAITTQLKIAVATLVNNAHHYLTQEDVDHIREAADNDFIRIADGPEFKKSAVMEILPTEDYARQFPDRAYDANRRTEPKKYEPPVGFVGIITREKRLGNLRRLGLGIKSNIDLRTRDGLTSPNSQNLLTAVRNRYLAVEKGLESSGQVPGSPLFTPHYEPKYKNWEEAKAAGVL